MARYAKPPALLLAAAAFLLSACAGPRHMMPTPNVYLDSGKNIFLDISPPLKSTEVQLLYVTDRTPERDEAGNLRYGYGRSESMGFGTVVVDLGAEITWEELVEASRTQRRLKPIELEVRDVTEILRGPPTPLPFTLVDNRVVEDPNLSSERAAGGEAFRRILLERLDMTRRKDVFIYIHGYHNTFEDAVFAMAELWHFLGRIGVPVVYTWPAGYPGLFGYTYDRESSEFTVYHLRRVLKFLAGVSEVERVHVIAHSRGTDVAITALRELTIEARAAGLDPREQLKIHNLVLAAPDLDVQVAQQRIIGDKLGLSTHRLTIYTSPADRAIGLASRLYGSPRGRVDTVGVDLPEFTKRVMEYSNANAAIVDFDGRSEGGPDRYGHSYFREAPSVSSDVVITLRDDLDPGEPGRPLTPVGRKLWRIPNGYPSSVGAH